MCESFIKSSHLKLQLTNLHQHPTYSLNSNVVGKFDSNVGTKHADIASNYVNAIDWDDKTQDPEGFFFFKYPAKHGHQKMLYPPSVVMFTMFTSFTIAKLLPNIFYSIRSTYKQVNINSQYSTDNFILHCLSIKLYF